MAGVTSPSSLIYKQRWRSFALSFALSFAFDWLPTAAIPSQFIRFKFKVKLDFNSNSFESNSTGWFEPLTWSFAYEKINCCVNIQIIVDWRWYYLCPFDRHFILLKSGFFNIYLFIWCNPSSITDIWIELQPEGSINSWTNQYVMDQVNSIDFLR